MPIANTDVRLGVHPNALRLLGASEWREASRMFVGEGPLAVEPPSQASGIAVIAGPGWSKPLDETPMPFTLEAT